MTNRRMQLAPVVAAVALLVNWLIPIQASQGARPADLFKQALSAIAPDYNLAQAKSVVILGSVRVRNQWFGGRGSGDAPEFRTVPFEIRALFPDYFYYREDIGAGGTSPAIVMRRTEVISRHKNVGTAFNQLQIPLLALLLRTDTTAGLRLESRLAGPSAIGFSGGREPIVMEIDPATKLPTQLRGSVRMLQGPDKGKERPYLYRLEDRRVISGVNVPFRIVLLHGEQVERTLTIQDLRLNAALSEKDFLAAVSR